MDDDLKNFFNENKITYDEALSKCNFKEKLVYRESLENKKTSKSTNRKRKIICFTHTLAQLEVAVI